jgi:hypothetical protein
MHYGTVSLCPAHRTCAHRYGDEYDGGTLKTFAAFLSSLLLLAAIAIPSYAQDDKPKQDEPKTQEVKPPKEEAPKTDKAAKDQEKHAQDQEKHAQDQQMKDQQKAQENQAKNQQKQEQDQAKHQQDQQAKQQQDQARHEQDKQAQENQKHQQEQAKQQQKDQQKQAAQQAKDQQKARDQQAHDQARNDHRNDNNNANRGHVQQASQRERIPDDKFRQHFGREHHFHPGHPRMVDNRPEISYSGYTFEFVDAWPTDWSYDDDCYIDYVDDGYYLYDPVHPGIRIAVTVIL